jgi:hypothetical protein
MNYEPGDLPKRKDYSTGILEWGTFFVLSNTFLLGNVFFYLKNERKRWRV